MKDLREHLQNILLSALNDVDTNAQREQFGQNLQRYVGTLEQTLHSYRDHSAQSSPTLATLTMRFKYETAYLHVVSRALAYDIGLSNTTLIEHLPIYQQDDLYNWYTLPEHLCREIDMIAVDVLRWDFLREFISRFC